ncbi:large ribosomal subunit protein uL4m [Halyomorpha halys]|uniref:large ribosomal subunit protein uL4m n=1 Tax=Halyomorpha halys TaxID=286706 RepID=UPI0006D4FC03|nr:39S ribosomal protein L4, mitochondrial [Halyomorpha halys]
MSCFKNSLVLHTFLRAALRNRIAFSTSTQTTEITSQNQEQSFPLVSRNLKYLSQYEPPRQAWYENLDSLEEKKLGIVDLHPDVFGVMPRIDVIHENVRWQRDYQRVSYAHTKVRNEVQGGGRKPWPQKGQGRARHGSIRSPLWKGGGIAHGPRSPKTYFYMLPFFKRVLGLTSTLSIKHAQDDLHIVNNLEIPTDDPKFLRDLIEERNWGVSVLFVDVPDIMPRNITVATDSIMEMNLIPVYGLNVYSMLKHETLVLTLNAVEKIEERILYQLHRPDYNKKMMKFRVGQQ